ncbi:hypothetical protein ABWH93_16660 [Seohaeicola saemankumensis]|uniref:hypothetical protein n=1 Tax=Seohaeicola saemankumensis TaxID=481181 RepID=UPI0035CFF85B
MAASKDRATQIAAEALMSITDNPTEKEKYKETLENKDQNQNRLRQFRRINSKNISTNITDGFLWYISNIIQDAMKRKPELVKSGEQIRIEKIFDHANKKDLINYLIDRRINSLSYGGMKEIENFMKNTLGVSVFKDEQERVILNEFIEIRNINTHNRGVVNRVFIDRLSSKAVEVEPKYRVGSRIHLDYDDLVKFSKTCIQVALEVDNKVSEKFNIMRKRVSTWDATSTNN